MFTSSDTKSFERFRDVQKTLVGQSFGHFKDELMIMMKKDESR